MAKKKLSFDESFQRAMHAASARQRKYHLVAINEKTGYREVLTSYPATHKEAVTMKSKFTPHKNVRIQLQEV